jgi:cytochrome c551/c552
MIDGLTVQKPNAVRAIMGQMSCVRCHAAPGNVEETG